MKSVFTILLIIVYFKHLVLTVLISTVNSTADHLYCSPCCRGKWSRDCLLIDGLVSQLGDEVEKLWKRDEGGTGKYPPASIHVGHTDMTRSHLQRMDGGA